MNKGNLFKGVLLIGMVAFVMAFSSCGDKNKPDPKKPDASTTQAEAKIAKFKFDGVDATNVTNLVLIKSGATTEQTLADLVKDAKGTVGTSTTEEALTIKKVEPPKATFKTNEDTKVTLTVGSDKYKDATLTFYVRLGTEATTKVHKAHKVTFSMEDAATDSTLTATYGATSATATIAIPKSELLVPADSYLKFVAAKGAKTGIEKWTLSEGYSTTAAATATTMEVTQKLTKDITVQVKFN